MTKEQQKQARMFEDSVADIVDEYLRDGMPPDVIERTLQAQASYVLGRAAELKQQEPA